jgi:succinoglycan biosynthesis transport protein ExoP
LTLEPNRDNQLTGRNASATTRLWRRKWLIVAIVAVATIVVYGVSSVLPKTYEATSTLWVSESGNATGFDAVQAGEALTRTYGDVAENLSVANEVAQKLPFETTGKELLGELTTEPVPETQLLRLTAQSSTADRATLIANVYANTVISYSKVQLKGATTSNVAHSTIAVVPTSPSKPKPKLYAAIAAFVALIIGCILALVPDLIDNRLRSPEQIAAITGKPVIGRIPTARGRGGWGDLAEAYRLLQVNIELTLPGDQLRSVAVVSAVAGEGKTSTAIGLARAFAESGKRVLLIDADLRQPTIHTRIFGRNAPVTELGLSSYLSGRSAIGEVVVDGGQAGLHLIPAGPLPSSPATLLQGTKAQELIGNLPEIADVVIIDTPPLDTFAEATTVASFAQTVVLVADAGQLTIPTLERASQQLAVANRELLGVALNRAHQPGVDTDSHYTDQYAKARRRIPIGNRGQNGSAADEAAPESVYHGDA